jgi:hypothetical protein
MGLGGGEEASRESRGVVPGVVARYCTPAKRTIGGDFAMAQQARSPEEDVLQVIVGKRLTSVEFVHDYVQLRLDGSLLNAVTQPSVEINGRSLHWGDVGFRDELCNRIGKSVALARIVPGEALEIHFDDTAIFRVSLRDRDYRTAEAVYFETKKSGEWWVL